MMKLDDEYLALTAELTHDIKVSSYLQLELSPGSRHLEVGSGNGHDSIALAELYPESQITGIDLYPDIVEVANRRVKEKGLDNVIHLNGDAAQYDFSGKFDSMRAERVFQHLSDEEIHSLVRHLNAYAQARCIFSMVGIDWETLTCTVDRRHQETFRMIKDYLIEVSNINFIHTAIDAFEANGFDRLSIETHHLTTGNFMVAFTAFNLENIAKQLAMDSDRMQAMNNDFKEDKHYFSVGGCTATFKNF